MATKLQKNLDGVDMKTAASLDSGSTEWVMKGIPTLPRVSEQRIAAALKPGVLLHPTRDLSEAEAVEVVENSYRQFSNDSLLSPLEFLFRNPTLPITSDKERLTLHPVVFTILLMIFLFVVLSIIVCNM